MNSVIKNIFLISALFIFVSCEKVIDLDIAEGEKLVYADAWITDQPGVQTIRLLESVRYLDKAEARPISSATVRLKDLSTNTAYDFNFVNGSYSFDPGAGNAIGRTGHEYELEIIYEGETFRARDILPRNTKIDSITVEYEEGSGDFEPEGYYAEFHAKDLAGAVDYYWIRTFQNGILNPYLFDMYSIDASFYPGISDGFAFIPPFREGITSREKPYQKGDEVKVVLRSVSADAYVFIEQAMKQIVNGGLFSEVLQNIPANINNVTNENGRKIYGWFGTVGETSEGVTVN